MAEQENRSLLLQAKALQKQQSITNELESAQNPVQESLLASEQDETMEGMLAQLNFNSDDMYNPVAVQAETDAVEADVVKAISYDLNYPKYDGSNNVIKIQPIDIELEAASPNFDGLTDKIFKVLSTLSNTSEPINESLSFIGFDTDSVNSPQNEQIAAKIGLGLIFAYAQTKSEIKAERHRISNEVNTNELSMDTAAYQVAFVNASMHVFSVAGTPSLVRDFLSNITAAENNNDTNGRVGQQLPFTDPASDDSVALHSLVITLLRSSPEYFKPVDDMDSSTELYDATNAFKQIVRNNRAMTINLSTIQRLDVANIAIRNADNVPMLRKSLDYYSSVPWKASKGPLNSVLSMLMNVMKGSPNLIQTGGDQTIFKGLSVTVSTHAFASVFCMDKQTLIDCLNMQRPNDEDFITFDTLDALIQRYNSNMYWVDLAVDSMNSKVASTINPLLELLSKDLKKFYFEYDYLGKHLSVRSVTNTLNMNKSPILNGLITDTSIKLVNPKASGMRENKFKMAVVHNLQLNHPVMVDRMKRAGDTTYSTKYEIDQQYVIDTFDIHFGNEKTFGDFARKLKLSPETVTQLKSKRADLYVAALSLSGLRVTSVGKIDVKAPRMVNYVVDPSIADAYVNQSTQSGQELKYNKGWVQPIAEIASTTSLGVDPKSVNAITSVLDLEKNHDDTAIKINTLVNVGSYLIGTPFSSELVVNVSVMNECLALTSAVNASGVIRNYGGVINPELYNTGHSLIDGDLSIYFNTQSIKFTEQMMSCLSKHSKYYKTYHLASLCLKAFESSETTSNVWEKILITSGYGKMYLPTSDDLMKIISNTPDIYSSVIERLAIENKVNEPYEAIEALSKILPNLLNNLHSPLDQFDDVMEDATHYVLTLSAEVVFVNTLKQMFNYLGIKFDRSNLSIFNKSPNRANKTTQSKAVASLINGCLSASPIARLGNRLTDHNRKLKSDLKVNIYPSYNSIYSSFDSYGVSDVEYNQMLFIITKSQDSNVYRTALKLREEAEDLAIKSSSREIALIVTDLLADYIKKSNDEVSIADTSNKAIRIAMKHNKRVLMAMNELDSLNEKATKVKSHILQALFEAIELTTNTKRNLKNQANILDKAKGTISAASMNRQISLLDWMSNDKTSG